MINDLQQQIYCQFGVSPIFRFEISFFPFKNYLRKHKPCWRPSMFAIFTASKLHKKMQKAKHLILTNRYCENFSSH